MANTVKTTKTTKQQNNSNSTYPISQRRACEILSLIGMILNLIGCAVVVLIGIFMLGNAAWWATQFSSDSNIGGITAAVISLYGVLLLLFGLLFSIPSILFYVFFKKYAKTNKQAIALPILAIIFGGVLNLIAGIVWLCCLPKSKN